MAKATKRRPGRPRRILLPPERIAAFKAILAVGLLSLNRNGREIVGAEDEMRLAVFLNSLVEAVLAQPILQEPADRRALIALGQIDRADKVNVEEGIHQLWNMVSSGIVNALVANNGSALAGFFADCGWREVEPLPYALRHHAKKYPLALRRVGDFLGLIHLALAAVITAGCRKGDNTTEAADFLYRPIGAALGTYEPTAFAHFLAIGQPVAVRRQVFVAIPLWSANPDLKLADLTELTPERLTAFEAIVGLAVKALNGKDLDEPSRAYLAHFANTAGIAPAQDAAIAGAMVDALVQHRDAMLAGFFQELDVGAFVPPAERGKRFRRNYPSARQRVYDFLHLVLWALTVSTVNHEGDGAPALAGHIVDILVLHEPAALAAFLADDQPKKVREQLATAIPLWSEEDRTAAPRRHTGAAFCA